MFGVVCMSEFTQLMRDLIYY